MKSFYSPYSQLRLVPKCFQSNHHVKGKGIRAENNKSDIFKPSQLFSFIECLPSCKHCAKQFIHAVKEERLLSLFYG